MMVPLGADEHPFIPFLVPGVHQFILVIDVDYTLFIPHDLTNMTES